MPERNVINCDYLIIGAGIAGIGLKYKLLGETILLDKNPFKYKIGESHVPSIFLLDPGIFSLGPKLMKMKSYANKLGTVFCDSFKGKYASQVRAPLGEIFSLHCERIELEQLLAKELNSDIRQEDVQEIDFKAGIVTTDKNMYQVGRYILDCSGPAMLLANKLKLVRPFEKFAEMKAQWGYWKIDEKSEAKDTWVNWTVLNRIGKKAWMWQIPLYGGTILSMWIIRPEEIMETGEFIAYAQSYSAPCYKLSPLYNRAEDAPQPYMTKIHSRANYARISEKPSGDNWILVGDAYCFADPVYSVGTAASMLEAVTVAEYLNTHDGVFNHEWYNNNCQELIKVIIQGMDVWYSDTGKIFDKELNDDINHMILRGTFARGFSVSNETKSAHQIQMDYERLMLTEKETGKAKDLRRYFKVYYFDRKAFEMKDSGLGVNAGGKHIRINNKNIECLLEEFFVGQRLSYPDICLIIELKVRNKEDRLYFWKLMEVIEYLCACENQGPKSLYFFHNEWYQTMEHALKLGDESRNILVQDPVAIDFYERLRGRIYLKDELDEMAKQFVLKYPAVPLDLDEFYESFGRAEQFGKSYCLSK